VWKYHGFWTLEYYGIYEYANQIVPIVLYFKLLLYYYLIQELWQCHRIFRSNLTNKNLTHSLQRSGQSWSSHNASHITCPSVLVWCFIHVAWVQMHCMAGNVKRWAWCCNIKLTHAQRDANGMLNKPGSWIIEPFGPLWLTLLACVPSGPNLCSHSFHRSLTHSLQPGVNSAAPAIH